MRKKKKILPIKIEKTLHQQQKKNQVGKKEKKDGIP